MDGAVFMSTIKKIYYPDDVEFIRVIFNSDGSVQIATPNDPHCGTEVEGEPRDTSALEVARLMNFAYRLGRADLIRQLREQSVTHKESSSV